MLEEIPTLLCPNCKQILLITEFRFRLDTPKRLKKYCNACRNLIIIREKEVDREQLKNKENNKKNKKLKVKKYFKICTMCHHNFPVEDFYLDKHTRDGLCYRCIKCEKKRRINRIKNREKECEKIYTLVHVRSLKKCKTCGRELIRDDNFVKDREMKDGYKNICNGCRMKKYAKRYKEDIVFRVMQNVRRNIWGTIKKYNLDKKERSIQYVGCPISKLVKHIESQWQPGMSWKNWSVLRKNGNDKIWQIDHENPTRGKLFDWDDFKKTESQLYEAFDWKNCRPVWAINNVRKGNKLDSELDFDPLQPPENLYTPAQENPTL